MTFFFLIFNCIITQQNFGLCHWIHAMSRRSRRMIKISYFKCGIKSSLFIFIRITTKYLHWMKCNAISYYKWKGQANFRYQVLHKRSGYKIFLHRIIYMLSLKSEQGQICCSMIKSKFSIRCNLLILDKGLINNYQSSSSMMHN